MKRHTPLPPLIFNVPMIANKTPRQVAQLLGPPDNSITSPGHDTQKNSYRNGAVVVIFSNGKATQMVLRDTRGLAFDKQSLSKLGLPIGQPANAGMDHVLRFENLCGMAAVSLFASKNGDAGLSHVFVAVHRGAAAAVAA